MSFLLLVLALGASLWCAAAGPENAQRLPRIAAEPTPGLIIQGHVWQHHEGGPGLAGVDIYRRYASYPWGAPVATTNADGFYQSDFSYIPGDEMVTVRAELDGYTFQPAYYYWRHYHGYRIMTLEFVATASNACYLPLVYHSISSDSQVKEEAYAHRR
jgi:hypothetical protein